MSPNKVSQYNKKQVIVPNTDVSQNEERATQRFVLIMIAIISITVIAGGVALYWIVGQYIKQTNKNKAQDITIGLMETKKANIEKLKPNYESMLVPGPNGKSNADLILIAMPTDEAYGNLIAMLEVMAQQSNIKMSTINKTAKTDNLVGNSYQFSLSLSGNFGQILDFLSKTENSARVFDFVSMDISGGTTSSSNVTVTATFKTYYNPPANIAPKEVTLSEYNASGAK